MYSGTNLRKNIVSKVRVNPITFPTIRDAYQSQFVAASPDKYYPQKQFELPTYYFQQPMPNIRTAALSMPGIYVYNYN